MFCAAWVGPQFSALAQQDWARKMFKEFSHDFGTVVRGEEVEYRFEIENVYEEDMRIESVTSSCGCTKATVTKNVLKTWEKAEIIAKFDTMAFSGPRSARLTVRFGRPYNAEVYLDVKGTIRTDTAILPGMINFGTFSDPAVAKQTITVTRYGNPNWKIEDVLSTYSNIKVGLKEIERNQNRVSYQLTAMLKDDAEVGYIQSELMILANDQPGRSAPAMRLPVPVMGNFSLPLQISPQVMNIGGIKAGEQVSKKVIIKAEQAFSLIDVTCPNSAFRVSAPSGVKKVHIVEVIYTAEDAGTNGESKLKFTTDLPGAGKEVELTAIVSVDDN